jgi:hypothetical protein
MAQPEGLFVALIDQIVNAPTVLSDLIVLGLIELIPIELVLIAPDRKDLDQIELDRSAPDQIGPDRSV